MTLHEIIKKREERISIVGLGYVGLPLAIAFAKVSVVTGFDISKEKIIKFREGIDPTGEVGNEELQKTNAYFTWQEEDLRACKFHIIAVPTPINPDKTPNLNPVMRASETVGSNLTEGSIVVYESTVYPGVTEDICLPILEKTSGLKCGKDFKIGYSPERINPGDKEHRLQTIVKVVSGIDDESLEDIAKVYEMVVNAGVYKAQTIRVAEAAKIIENSQRDINIALMNEISIIFNKLGIDTKAVLEAARTKWNFLDFTPGLVGGHCIGVDPYYLTYKAEQIGYRSQVILAGRKINDEMGIFVAQNTVKKMIQSGKHVKGAKVAVFGITFKEDCPDTRNTKVVDIVDELKEYGANVQIVDPVAYEQDLFHEYGIRTVEINTIKNLDALIIAVPHKQFRSLKLDQLKTMFSDSERVLIDVKGMLDRKEAARQGFTYWSL